MYQRLVGIFNLIFDEDIELETLIVCVAILSCSCATVNAVCSSATAIILPWTLLSLVKGDLRIAFQGFADFRSV
jgi:hypothetical protein